MRFSWGFASLGLALLAGACALPGRPAAEDGGLSLRVVPRVAEADGARGLQAVVLPHVTGDVAGMVVSLRRLASAPPSTPPSELPVATQSLAPAGFGHPLTFTRLHPNTTYRVRGFAYDAGAAQISRDDTSFIDVAVGTDDAPSVPPLVVHLADTAFEGTATSGSGTTIVPGGYASPAASPTVTLE